MLGHTITFTKTDRHHSGVYTCTAENSEGSPAKGVINLEITCKFSLPPPPPPPPILFLPFIPLLCIYMSIYILFMIFLMTGLDTHYMYDCHII